ncbi:hypothetical protein JCM15519_12490 [Fundidesulfovibrio butyratiphilus]
MTKFVGVLRRARNAVLILALALATTLAVGSGWSGGGAANAQAPQMVISGTGIDGQPSTSPLSKAAFDHQKHEAAVAQCETCHHASMDRCSACHTSAGAADGGYIQLSRAMHDPRARMSCVGCHEKETRKQNCAGCHQHIAAGPNPTSCTACHHQPKVQTQAQVEAQAQAQPTGPDSVVIGSLSKKFDACTFDHSVHVEALAAISKGSPLAQAFHAQPGTLCQGCHHHTPLGQTPPKCGSCHSKPFQGQDPKRPGLMAAYHIQCNQCHKAMAAGAPAPTDCETCHTAKK